MISRSYMPIAFSLIIALMLVMLPLPDWARVARPDWVSLALIYWAMALPRYVGVGHAFTLGLLLDVSQGTLLGQHALGLVIIVFLVQQLYLRIRIYTLIQQAFFVCILLVIKQLVVLWVNGMIDHAPETALYFLPAVTGAVMWPWIFILLRDIRRRFCPLTDR